jgi:arsenate reductase
MATAIFTAMREILFLCPHGGAKSVIAACHFNRLAEERALPFRAASAAAEDPYDSVPAPVSEYLLRQGTDVRALRPRRVASAEIETAARVVAIGCELERATDRWDGVPAASEDLAASVAAIHARVEALARELDGGR